MSGSRKSEEGVHLSLRISPNARQNRVVGRINGLLQIKINAPPRRGKANAELVRFLSELLEVPRSSIEILHGEHSREKRIRVAALNADEVEQRINKMIMKEGTA